MIVETSEEMAAVVLLLFDGRTVTHKCMVSLPLRLANMTSRNTFYVPGMPTFAPV
jgi:hypothetical protein